MKNVWYVARFEFQSILSKRSFWVTTFLLPVLILGLTFGSQLVFSTSDSQQNLNQEQVPVMPENTGLVDPASILDKESIRDSFILYPSKTAAQSALQIGEIDACFVLDASTIQTGQVEMIVREYSPFQQLAQSELMEGLLEQHLSPDRTITTLLSDPFVNIELVSLAPEPGTGFVEPLAGSDFFVPYIILFLFFMMISSSSGMALRAVSKEKENQTAEILLGSLRPIELLTGKLIGISAVTLLQILMWFLVLQLGSRNPLPFLDLPNGYKLPDNLVFWAIPLLLSGFVMYGSALIAIGVLAPTARESSQFTFLIYLPLMLPMILNSLFVTAPQSALVTFLSLFPPTAPLSMITRLTVVPVPLWELAASLAGIVLVAGFLLLAASRLFRADTLLSSSSLDIKRLVSEFLAVFGKDSRRSQLPDRLQ